MIKADIKNLDRSTLNAKIVSLMQAVDINSSRYQELSESLIKLNSGLIELLINKYAKNINYADAKQESHFALIKAARTFDASKGALFSSYFSRNVEFELLNLKRKSTMFGHITSVNRSIDKAYASFVSDGVFSPSIEQVSQKTNLSEIDLQRALAARKIISLEQPLGDESTSGQLSIADALSSEENIEQTIITKMDNELTKTVIDTLNQFDQALIKMFYGENKSRVAISKELDCSPRYISMRREQIHTKLKEIYTNSNKIAALTVKNKLNNKYTTFVENTGFEPTLQTLLIGENIPLNIFNILINFYLKPRNAAEQKITDFKLNTAKLINNLPENTSKMILDLCIVRKPIDLVCAQNKMPIDDIKHLVHKDFKKLAAMVPRVTHENNIRELQKPTP